MRKVDVAERRARLARRHRLAPGGRAGDVVEAAGSVVCLHATDPATVYLSARARVEGMEVAGLVERWLRCFGPGTEADLKWWLGSTVKAVRGALAGLDVVEVDLDGRTGYLLPDDLEPTDPVEPWGALLPSLDSTTMGWLERDWYLGPHKEQLFDSNGNAGHTVWWDGRIVGGWRQEEDGEVVLQILEDVGAEGEEAIEREAARLDEWLGGRRVTPRFPSPLSKLDTGAAPGGTAQRSRS